MIVRMVNEEKLRFVVLEVVSPHCQTTEALENMSELELLVSTVGGIVIEKTIQHRFKPDLKTYIGSGKVAWLLNLVKEEHIDVVVLNDLVGSGQLFRLEQALWKVHPRIKVWDRIDLILEIFEQHAHSREAKLQIELARIQHLGPRIYGLGKTLLSRQGGGIGARGGAGETNIELEKRLIKQRQQQINKELKVLSRQKQQRIMFRKEQGIGPVALVGYTSAGKTSLFNALTGKVKQTSKELFTTLDTVVGKLKTPDSRVPILVSDTIGFINNLPPNLIKAFRSTLMESVMSELVLHVIDANDADVEEKVAIVDKILNDLNIDKPVILVFNKVDLVDDERLKLLERMFEQRACRFVSALTGEGLGDLKRLISMILVE